MSPKRKIAAFDFDGTITERDTLFGFLVAVGGRASVASALARNTIGMVRGARDDSARDAAKERVLGEVLRGRSESEVSEAGEAYALLLQERFRQPTIERLRWHQTEGHETIIVSASLIYYLRPLAASLEIGDVIGVEMETDATGIITGSLAHPNVRAEEKATRLRRHLGEGAVEVWAYGNSSGDDALLTMADHPIWVGKRSIRNA